MTLRIGGYSRVSTDEQANVLEGSLDNQQHRIKAFVEIKNMQEPAWGNVTKFYVEDGYSAKDTNRPAYQRMMRDLKSGNIDAIMVTELSRLSRNIPDFCDFHKVLEALGAKFFSIKEQFDTSTPSGKMMLYNMINLAQFEREQTSERVAINAHARAMRGLLNGGPAILGYDKDSANKTTFAVNAAEAILVRDIFDVFLEELTLGRTIRVLEVKGIKPKIRKSNRLKFSSEARWTTDSLRFVLHNMAYVGLREINRHNKHLDQDKLKPWARHGVTKASWPAIIEQKTFDRVQAVLKQNHTTERLRLETATNRVFSVSNICRCGTCGRKLVGQSAHGRSKLYRYYVHTGKNPSSNTCGFKRIDAEGLESKISEHLTEIILEGGYFERIESRIKECLATDPKKVKADKVRISTELKKIALAYKNTFKIQSVLDADSDAIRLVAQELEAITRKERALKTELDVLKSAESNLGDADNTVCDLQNRIQLFRKGWKRASAVTKKSLIKDLIAAVIVGPKELKIQYRL